MMYFLYNLFLTLLTPLLLLFFLKKKKATENLTASNWRLGHYPPDFLPSETQTPRIWIHAASVGEISAIIPFIRKLRETYPQAWIGVSTMTQSGLTFARENLPEADRHFLAPFDLFWTARRAVRQIRPTLLITAETEIWPNLIRYARQSGSRILMINGRISKRSVSSYQKFRGFLGKVLSNYDKLSVILPDDAERLISIGAPAERIQINGNIKYDRLIDQAKPEFREVSKGILNLTGEELLLIAGSTREGEEELILEAYQKIRRAFPDLILLIAPRHIQRAAEICRIVERYGFKPLLRTDITPETVVDNQKVIILNTIGELSKVYSLATLAFCGASLVPLGGQNPLEPAAWGKVVLYGPSMDDFLDAKALLEKAGAGYEVQDPESLARQVVELLQQSDQLAQKGQAAREAILSQQGSTQRNLQLAINLIEGGNPYGKY